MSNIGYNHIIMERLEQQLYARLKPLLENRSLHYIDIPMYHNVGDLFIYKGTEIALETMHCEVSTRVAMNNAQHIFNKNIGQDELIVMQGGGNFGDIWPGHHQLRLNIAKAFPDHSIIMLPQSIHFNDPSKLDETIDVFGTHKNCLLFLRDQASYDLLAPHLGDKVEMLPDMAQAMYSWLNRRDDKTGSTMILRRDDKEQTAQFATSGETFDWDDMFGLPDKVFLRIIMQFACKAEMMFGRNLGAMTLWAQHTDRVISRAQRIFERYDVIDTDRLHGAIFALLLGKDIILRDNSYGKLSRYFSAWYTAEEGENEPRKAIT